METQNKVELETQIENVIVYQNGVQINEKGSVSLKNGEYNLMITDLPESLDEESVRVKGIGNGRIVNIVVDFNSRKKYRTEEHQKLNEQKEKLEENIKLKEKKIERSREQVDRYKNAEETFYTLWAKAFAVDEVNLENFSIFSEKIDQTIDKKLDEIHGLEEEIKNLRSDLQVVLNKINNLGPIEEIQNFYEIMVNLQVAKEGEFKLEIRYNMVDAYWIPFYDASLTESE
ncbi:MAG: DUF4140 domain-containing protein, partial [Candidatus Lokiarchaeota archaeon]|nr:DUF4140 domain-containing protein [Candidatus Lokiarchaeota archaeon]MBD3340574.1 DUF4140 domain-containing protein [Candidatus Lokiarchaeota archaeon]